MLLCGINGPVEFGLAAHQGASIEIGLLGLALQAAQLLAGIVQTALGGHGLVFELGMPFLAIGKLHVKFFKLRLRLHKPFLQVLGHSFNFCQILVNLLRAVLRLLGQLVQLQGRDLQGMGFGLRFAGSQACAIELQPCLVVGGLGTGQCVAGLFMDQGLGAHLFLQVFNFLRPRQQTRLFVVGRIKTHAQLGDTMPLRHINHLTGHQGRPL